MEFEAQQLKRFMEETKNHVMTIINDNGLNRHLKFRRPQGCYHFDVITWSGYLCICGDMGTYVFQRIEDMFAFFRHAPKDDGSLYINSGYWAEKCVAMDRHSQIERYSEDLFRKCINDWMDESEFDDEARQAVEDDIFCYADDEGQAIAAVMRFERNGFTFQDFWEINIKEYSVQFIWCLYAISWAIQKYDESKK